MCSHTRAEAHMLNWGRSVADLTLRTGTGRKISGNNYLHTFRWLISLRKCLDVHQPSLPRSHQSRSICQEQSRMRKFSLAKKVNEFLNLKTNACIVCNKLFSLGVFSLAPIVLVSFPGTRDCSDLCGYLGNNRFRRGAVRR